MAGTEEQEWANLLAEIFDKLTQKKVHQNNKFLYYHLHKNTPQSLMSLTI